MKTRTASSDDFDAMLALNLESERFLSPLTRERPDSLHRQADLDQVIEVEGEVVAFVLALREGASYDSINYRGLYWGQTPIKSNVTPFQRKIGLYPSKNGRKQLLN